MYTSRSSSSCNLDKFPEGNRSFLLTSGDSTFANDPEIVTLLETIDKQMERQKLCSKTYQFKEAAEAKNKIIELKREVIMKKGQNIERRHREEIAQIMEAQSFEIEKFSDFWQKKLEEFEAEAINVEQQMLSKHEEDQKIMKEELGGSMNPKPMKTAEHLRYLNMVESLAKNEDFLEADRFLKKCATLEKQELVKAKVERDKKIKIILGQLTAKQGLEMGSLKQKIASGKEKMVKMREDEHDKLQQKSKNMLQEIEIAQQLQISKFELAYKNYIPGEKLSLSPKKRSSTSVCGSEASLLNTSTSLSNLDKSLNLVSMSNDKKSLAGSHKNLMDIISPKTGIPNAKDKQTTKATHKRGNSLSKASSFKQPTTKT